MSNSPPPIPVSNHGKEPLVADMESQYGPLIGGSALYRALGLPSAAAFRQAASRGVLPVAVFSIPHRRGRFALTREVAEWLIQLKASIDGDGVAPTKQAWTTVQAGGPP